MAMKFYIILLLAANPVRITPDSAPVKVIDVETLEKIIHDTAPGIRVINFWATWCKPCIEELPYFESLGNDPALSEVDVYLISLDFVSDLDSRVMPFLDIKDIRSTVMLLDNTDYNSWINKVDPEWTGAIPATLMVNGATGERIFFEKQFEEGELQQNLKNFIHH